jgi:Spy/CpxP family protein refolding chaperone
MKKTVFALAVAAIALAAVPAAQAAPVAPLPAGVATANGNVVHVQFWWWHHHRWHHRHCWRGRYGRLRCRYW